MLPDNTIGRHALSHIAWPLERLDRQPSPRQRRSSDDCALVRALFEAGYHRELNARLNVQLLPTLAGGHDIERFASTAGTVARFIVRALATEVGIRR